MHNDHYNEGDQCSGCGREWRHREGDGGKNGPLSCYHAADCPLHPTPATQQSSIRERLK